MYKKNIEGETLLNIALRRLMSGAVYTTCLFSFFLFIMN